MVNKALRIVLYSIFTISLLFVMPVNIYADGLIVVNGSDYLLGINVDLYDSSIETYVNQAFITSNNGTSNYSQYTQTNTISTIETGTYKYTFVFNKSYVGRIVLQYVVPNSQTTRQFTLFVNGTTAEYYSSRDTRYSSTSTFINNWTLTSAQLVEHDDIQSLEEIIDLLTDIYSDTTDLVGASSDILDELMNIVSNTSLANQYLQILSQYRQWNFPYESFNAIYTPIFNNLERIDNTNFQQFYYPVFRLKQNDIILHNYMNTDVEYIYIFAFNGNISNSTPFTTFFSSNLTLTTTVTKLQNNINIFENDANLNGYLYQVIMKNTGSSGSLDLTYIYNRRLNIIPIYFARVSDKNISTDFALRFGLSNQLLDDLHLIADGTNDSSAASSQSDLANQQLQTDSNTLFTQEDSFKQDMNSAMQNIDTTFSLNNFGSSFMTSAQWVRTQYETLTNNTPFASLITFSLLVGLALIVIGKVYK